MGLVDVIVKCDGGRKEVFEIDEDEQLIGCEIDEDYHNWNERHRFVGVTWLKMKTFN